MGQKANFETIRKFLKSINLITATPHEFLTGFNFLKYFNLFFTKKNLLLTATTLNFNENKAQLTVSFFCRTALQKKIKKLLAKLKKKARKKKELANLFIQPIFREKFYLQHKLCLKKIQNIVQKKDTNQGISKLLKSAKKLLKDEEKQKTKMKLKKSLDSFKTIRNDLFKHIFVRRIFKELTFLRINLLTTNYLFLDDILLKNKVIIKFLYLKFKLFRNSLFTRRINLFGDFLKISSLFANGIVNSKTFLFILSQIFRYLLKRQHARFLIFLKKLFKIYISKGLKYDIKTKKFIDKNKTNSNIYGLKFLISGRLKGKLRSTQKFINFGSVTNQTISKNIDFQKTGVFTRYSVFGFKLWTYRKH